MLNQFGSDHDALMQAKIKAAEQQRPTRAGNSPTTHSGDPKRAEGEKYRKLVATVDVKPMEFDSATQTWLVSQDEFSKIINNIFRPSFPQFAGTKTTVTNNGIQIYAYFTHKENADYRDGIEVFRPRMSGVDMKQRKSADLVNIMAMHGKNQYMWELTQEGKDALSEFVSDNFRKGDPRDNNYDWSKIKTEVEETDFYGRRTLYVQISLDPIKLLKKMFGRKSPEGFDWVYMMNPQCPIPGHTIQMGNGNMAIAKYLLSILKINPTEIEKASREVYNMPFSGNLGIYRQ